VIEVDVAAEQPTAQDNCRLRINGARATRAPNVGQ
jgi:hypothetical protein